MTAAALRPRALRPGGRVLIAAPSGPVPEDRFAAGLEVLRTRVEGEISLAPNLFARTGYLAGDDAERLAILQQALGDPTLDAIVCARGGYGLTRLLPRLDPTALLAAPKLLVGFSDVSALLCWALRAGLASVHGPVVTQLAELEEDDVERLAATLRGEEPAALAAEEGAVLRGGRVEGPLVPANLEVLRSLIGTKFLPDLSGCIVALEEIGERPYRLDRALTHLLTSGAFYGVRGFAIGQLVACAEPPAGNPASPSAQEVLLERLGTLGVPVVTGFPFGHDPKRNAALPCGTRAQLDADHGALYFLEPAARP